MSLLIIVLVVPGESARQALSLDRSAVQAGEYWRLLSGHFCHLGHAHAVLNGLGVALVALLCWERLTARGWWIVSCICCIGTSFGLWFFSVTVQNYVGFSGVLHGLLVTGLLFGLRSEQRREAVLVLFAIVAKLAFEQSVGPLPGSERSAGGAVIVDAHLYGAISGVIAWLFLWPFRGKLGYSTQRRYTSRRVD